MEKLIIAGFLFGHITIKQELLCINTSQSTSNATDLGHITEECVCFEIEQEVFIDRVMMITG